MGLGTGSETPDAGVSLFVEMSEYFTAAGPNCVCLVERAGNAAVGRFFASPHAAAFVLGLPAGSADSGSEKPGGAFPPKQLRSSNNGPAVGVAAQR